MLLGKKCQFFLNLSLIKMSLQIMLSNFAGKKETFFDLKKQNLSKSKKTHFFKGVNPCFWSKNAIFLIYSDLVKTRVEIMLKLHWREKRNRFDYKKQRFSKSKTSHFFKGVNPCFWSKNAIFFLYLDFVKIRLQIMLNYFKEKKRNLF